MITIAMITLPVSAMRRSFGFAMNSLKKEDIDILHSLSAWVNVRIKDEVQKLMGKTIGGDRSYQFVLNTQRKVIIPFPQ